MRALLLVPLGLFSCVFLVAAAPHKPTAGERRAMELVKGDLKDPDSAVFKKIIVDKDGHGTGCVNARNSFGGFTGFAYFAIGPDDQVHMTDPDISETLCK